MTKEEKASAWKTKGGGGKSSSKGGKGQKQEENGQMSYTALIGISLSFYV